jgi:hypothetical protein
MLPKIRLNTESESTVVAKVISPRRESTSTEYIPNLDPELTAFCSCLSITPTITEFHDEDDSIHNLSISNHSSDIEDESELQKFTQALQMAQRAASIRNKKKRGVYSKKSKNTLKRRKLLQIDMVSKGFLPMEEYIRRKGVPVKYNTPTPQLDKIVLRDESEEGSDEAIALDSDRDTCTYSSVRSVSEVESEGSLPGNPHNVRHDLRHCIRMESEESSEGGDGDGVGDDARHAASKHLEDLRREASQVLPGSDPTSQLRLLSDHPRLREASVQLTNEMKKDSLDVIVQARIAAMAGLLNIYTDNDMGYSWRKASEMVSRMQGRGANHARHIRQWTMGFLKERDLPFHRLNQKRGTIIDDEDIAEEIKTQMKEKASRGFLKAEDLVEIVASPSMQAVFALKGISKPSISTRTALRWLESLGWTYGKLKNGMYLDGHERSDVVEYRRAFMERWMGYERRFHRWDNDGTELPRPIGFPVPGAIGRFRLILVTHDESTFFQNDERNTGWSHAASKSKPKAKGNGQSLMVSDFLTPDWGRLRDGDE